MVNQKLKDKKKKLREKEQLKELEVQEIMHGKPKPFRRPKEIAPEEAEKRARVTSQLERNLKLLEALEKEYEEEQAAREQINEDLESQGHKTMKEKMDALHQKALEITGKAGPLAEATAEYEKEKEKS